MTIHITCRTNLDEYKGFTWPTRLPAVPQVGQYMETENKKRLKIVSTTWLFDGTLEVELHKGLSL